MKPSVHYAQHHRLEAPRVDELAFRPAWRVQTLLDRLLDQKAISAAEWGQAVAFRRDLELIIATAYPLPPALGVPFGTRRTPLLPAIRFDALDRIGKVRAVLGDGVCGLLRAALIEDPSWAALGARLRVDPRTARAWVILAIRALAAVEKA